MMLNLFQSAALLLSLCWLQAVNAHLLRSRGLTAQFVSGLLFGGVCVIGMLTATTIQPGIIHDARTVVLSMAGLFGGPLVAGIAALLAGGFRLWLGGAGVVVGLSEIVLAVLLGLAYRSLYLRGKVSRRVLPLWLFGLLVQVQGLLLLVLLPSEYLLVLLAQTAVPMLLVMPVATVLLGSMLEHIEQRKRMDLVLKMSEARQRAITEAIPDLLLVLDQDGRYLEVVYPKDNRLHSLCPRRVGQSLFEVLPHNDAWRLLNFIQQTLASDGPQKIEYSIQGPQGLMVLEGRAQRLDGPIDGKRAVVFLVRDITERMNAERELRIAAIAFESQQGMIISDPDSRILRVNKAFSAITGYSAEDVLGQKTRMLSSGRQSPEFYQSMWRSLSETDRWEGEIWNRRKSGEIFPEWLSISAVRNGQGQLINYVASLTDSTERKAAEDRIKQLAFYDALTALPNRRLLLEHLQHAVANSARSGQFAALMFLDLDNFKNVNDLYGHQAGDKLLCLAAERLGNAVRASDTVARLGGDEFVVMLEGLGRLPAEAAGQAKKTAEKVLAALAAPYRVGTAELRSSVSVGVVLFSDESCSCEELMMRADLSMYEAKAAGKSAVRFFDPVMQDVVSTRLRLEEEIDHGLLAGEFIGYLQPQVDEAHGLLGAEVLARWQHPLRGLLGPATFIEVAERAGLVERLDFQMLRGACELLALWRQQPALERLSLAVNISARLLYQVDFVERLLDLLQETGANPGRLKLELTESLLLDDLPGASARMLALKSHGIRFSIDDFGTGYSSMAYLQQLPLDQLKIDQSFVRKLPEDGSSLAIIRAICALAISLELEVIAEGVETEAQLSTLRDTGCQRYQGYLFGRPMPLVEFEGLAMANTLDSGREGQALRWEI
ncbi:EAL domain-containing protein [Pseudomonas sp. MMS21-TM103]|uniref:EAL domain-containing protein n=1 Tax=Pseudomonas sp. MMS21 TM103 TaxID=2886506 RepID=UPI001EE1254C|nr:EAL domain-containing protein [Pseudomonas sp. MMS21 TM103]MCG4455248.1 EAL domain-containing protein [Pseudomonas sp. MMS21 TM103]